MHTALPRATALPFWTSPFGPVGMVKGGVVRAVVGLENLYHWVGETAGLPPIASIVLVVMGLVLSLGLCTLIIVMTCCTGKEKAD